MSLDDRIMKLQTKDIDWHLSLLETVKRLHYYPQYIYKHLGPSNCGAKVVKVFCRFPTLFFFFFFLSSFWEE